MAVLNPLHLLEQAVLLVEATPGRKPRQVNLRRAVSSAYYAVFHHILTATADEFVGRSLRNDRRYLLAYRSVDHGAVRSLCNEAARAQPSPKYAKHLQGENFDAEIKKFAANFLVLQSSRHEADYDPRHSLASVDARFAIYLAESAIASFNAASVNGRRSFLTILAFPPR